MPRLVTNPAYAGKTVLVCWHHGTLPELAEALGATNVPGRWRDSVFDRVLGGNVRREGESGGAVVEDRLHPLDGRYAEVTNREAVAGHGMALLDSEGGQFGNIVHERDVALVLYGSRISNGLGR